MSIIDNQKKIISEFAQFHNWEDKYKKIIELGKTLETMPAQFKTEDNLVKGCQSQVWLHAELKPNGTITYFADSDALIVKGLISILLAVYNHSDPNEILNTPTDIIQKLGFEGNISPNRANGLAAMIKQIYYFATAYQYLLNSQKKV